MGGFILAAVWIAGTWGLYRTLEATFQDRKFEPRNWIEGVSWFLQTPALLLWLFVIARGLECGFGIKLLDWEH